MISAATGGTVVNYSNRFSLSGMTGVFPASVTAGLANIEGTNGPKTENNDVANGPAADDGDAAKGASVAFTLQTGPTRYAPMKGKPGTTITAKTASRMFPMSSYVIAKSFLPTPIAVTTQTVSATYSVSSMEHTVCGLGKTMKGYPSYRK